MVLLYELWNTILNNISDVEQKKKNNSPFRLTATSSLLATLDSCDLKEDLDNRLKHDTVIVA